MRAALHNPPVVEDEDLVGVLHRRDAVRHDDARSLAHDAAEAAEDLGLGVRVDRRKRVVQDQHAGILRDRAGDPGALLLPARERHAPLSDHRVVARWKILHVLVEL